MKSERELYEELQNNSVLKRLVFIDSLNMYLTKDEYSDDDLTIQYCLEINHGWKMWQASASRGGYKLLPSEPTEEMIKKAEHLYIVEMVDIFSAVLGAYNADNE